MKPRWSSAFRRARELSRFSALPEPKTEHPLVHALVWTLRGLRNLARRVLDDRIAQRAAGLAFQSVLSLAPITAVTMAALRAFFGRDALNAAVVYVAESFLPPPADAAIAKILPRIEGLDLGSIGIVGSVALLPVMIGIVSEVEFALADVFRTPRRARLLRLPIYALLVTIAPMAALATALYAPHWDIGFVSRHLLPALTNALLLFLAFRFLPFSPVRTRGALAGALVAAALVEVSKLGFGIWATRLALGMHAVWGAVAIFPLLLVWVFVSWLVVLFGAEIAAVVHDVLQSLHAARLPKRRARRRPLGSRARVRAFWKRARRRHGAGDAARDG